MGRSDLIDKVSQARAKHLRPVSCHAWPEACVSNFHLGWTLRMAQPMKIQIGPEEIVLTSAYESSSIISSIFTSKISWMSPACIYLDGVARQAAN